MCNECVMALFHATFDIIFLGNSIIIRKSFNFIIQYNYQYTPNKFLFIFNIY